MELAERRGERAGARPRGGEPVPSDLASLDEVRELARRVERENDRLDVLVNNAGIGTAGAREESRDGYELRFAVNYLAGFLLTRMLLPLLEHSAPARIVNVASAGQTPIDFDDVMLERSYNGVQAYCQSKLAQVMFTFDLAEELCEPGSDGQLPASGDVHADQDGAGGRAPSPRARWRRGWRRRSGW